MSPSRSVSEFFSLRLRPWDLLTACGVIASLATVLGFLGRIWWFFDLFSHFRVQYLFGLMMVALILLFPRRYKAAAILALMAMINLATIVPLYFGRPSEPQPVARHSRVMLTNVHTESGNPEKVAQAINQLKPDLLVLEEVNAAWLSALSASLQVYRHSSAIPREDNFGIALYSRFPFVRSEIRQIGAADVPSVIAEVDSPGGRFTVIATHPLPPASPENSRLRNEQFARLAVIVQQANQPVLVVGDLNATPWSYHFRELLRQSGLRDSSQGRGPLATWPTYLPILLIPIDHCLHTAGIHVTRRNKGPNAGSDHYPLVVDFVVAASPRKISQPSPFQNTAPPHP